MLLGGQPRLTEEPKKSRAQHGQKGEYSNVPKVRTMKTLVAVAILAMVIVPPRSGEGEAGAISAPARLSVVGATRLLPRLPFGGLVPRLVIELLIFGVDGW